MEQTKRTAETWRVYVEPDGGEGYYVVEQSPAFWSDLKEVAQAEADRRNARERDADALPDLLTALKGFRDFKTCRECSDVEMCEDCWDAYDALHIAANLAIAKAEGR